MDSEPQIFAPARAAGLARLEGFRPRMGRFYARGRNYDLGPGRRAAVSGLSPYLRRRLVTEQEVVAAALADHGRADAETFIQEVFWRGYFKGWLERRPEVWRAYVGGLAADRAVLAQDRALAKRVARAEAGATGVDCFDAWAAELVETGYMHNHARMWFASIWVFTLELPWRLGADFFFRHLLDGDPASNTLGWRWVAGLHTRGKAYAAQAWNIAKFTDQRFQPQPTELNEAVFALSEPEPLPPARPIRTPPEIDAEAPSALLLTEEDCCVETLTPDLGAFRATAALPSSALRSELATSAAVSGFELGALADAAQRALAAGAPAADQLSATAPGSLADWACDVGARQIATAYVPVGPLRDWLDAATPSLAARGVALVEKRRAWDDLIWRHATAGFFKVKKQIPAIIDRLEI